MSNNERKEKLTNEFVFMKDFEKSAKDFYLKVASDGRVSDEKIKKVFREIAQDEERHAEIVQKIIDIIKINL